VGPCLFDVGNVVLYGSARLDSRPWLPNYKVHLKDFKRGKNSTLENLGDGDIDWRADAPAFLDRLQRQRSIAELERATSLSERRSAADR